MTRKPVDSDTKDLTTATMTRNDKKYKGFTSCNNVKVVWVFHWKDGHEVGKMTRWLLALLIFPLLMAILPVKSPCTLTIIARGAPFVLLVIAGHGGCFQILVI